jgi:hypothetical protein
VTSPKFDDGERRRRSRASVRNVPSQLPIPLPIEIRPQSHMPPMQPKDNSRVPRASYNFSARSLGFMLWGDSLGMGSQSAPTDLEIQNSSENSLGSGHTPLETAEADINGPPMYKGHIKVGVSRPTVSRQDGYARKEACYVSFKRCKENYLNAGSLCVCGDRNRKSQHCSNFVH